jgi:hypothetical protein
VSDHLSHALETIAQLQLQLFSKGARFLEHAGVDAMRTAGLNGFLLNRVVEGMIPAIDSVGAIQAQIAGSLLEVAAGKRTLLEHVREMGDRTSAGMRYAWLVTTFGKELFGSATFEGERLLAEDEIFTLSYLPAQAPPPIRSPHSAVCGPTTGIPGVALFHVGGFLPFGDRIFRMLPETNLFLPFLRRGIPVYALEVRRDRPRGEALTIERMIDTIEAMSERAFAHNSGRKLMLEGYCGLAMQALAYIAALPASADRKLAVAFTMVGPIDGRRCAVLNDMVERLPSYAVQIGEAMADLGGGLVSGETVRRSIDLPFASYFWKTPLGRFATGWGRRELAGVREIADLDFAARRELAGGYWISPENSHETPIPSDVVRFSARLWREGIAPDGGIPFHYRGRPLSLAAIRDGTAIALAGFYGAKDKVVPPDTARVLAQLLGDRYTHVVHPGAGHIAYVLSPEVWDPTSPCALAPDPIDVVLELYRRSASQR